MGQPWNSDASGGGVSPSPQARLMEIARYFGARSPQRRTLWRPQSPLVLRFTNSGRVGPEMFTLSSSGEGRRPGTRLRVWRGEVRPRPQPYHYL